MDYDRKHQSHLESKYKAQKQNRTFLSFHPLYEEYQAKVSNSVKSQIFKQAENDYPRLDLGLLDYNYQLLTN